MKEERRERGPTMNKERKWHNQRAKVAQIITSSYRPTMLYALLLKLVVTQRIQKLISFTTYPRRTLSLSKSVPFVSSYPFQYYRLSITDCPK
jgi:hypothetical protein